MQVINFALPLNLTNCGYEAKVFCL